SSSSPEVEFMQRAHSPSGHCAEAATHCPKSRPLSSCSRQSSTQTALPSADDERPENTPTAAALIPEKNNRKASLRVIPLARSLESLSKCFFIRSSSLLNGVSQLSRRSERGAGCCNLINSPPALRVGPWPLIHGLRGGLR